LLFFLVPCKSENNFLLNDFLHFLKPLVSEKVTFFFVTLTSYSSLFSESLELFDSFSDNSEATSLLPRVKALVSSSFSLDITSLSLLLESEDDSSEIV